MLARVAVPERPVNAKQSATGGMELWGEPHTVWSHVGSRRTRHCSASPQILTHQHLTHPLPDTTCFDLWNGVCISSVTWDLAKGRISVRIANAIYQLSEIQRVNHPARAQRERARLPAHTPVASPDTYSKVSVHEDSRSGGTTLTLAEMLRDHFIEEVRQRDRDGDGMLTPSEYGGDREDFRRLDRDGDGRVGARDLIREALNRNAQLTEMVAGRWAPVYDRILRVEDSDNEDDLIAAVREGIAVIHETPGNQGVSPSRDGDASSSDGARSTTTELFMEFISTHKDLTALHQRIQDLADRLGRQRRYVPIDVFV